MYVFKSRTYLCDIRSRSVRKVSDSGEDQTVKEAGKVKVKFLPSSSVCALCCSFERKVILQLITDNEVSMMGAETMM